MKFNNSDNFGVEDSLVAKLLQPEASDADAGWRSHEFPPGAISESSDEIDRKLERPNGCAQGYVRQNVDE